MQNDCILAPAIDKLLNAYANRPHGSLFISGPKESDLAGIANHLLEKIYAPEGIKIGQIHYLSKNTIDSVRRLLGHLAKTRFDATKPRMIVIRDCNRLKIVAQNALLKGLEEPPQGSHFLLYSSKPWEVLPTIISRCQELRMQKPLKSDLFMHWSDYEERLLEQAYWAADGWPVLMQAYLGEPESRIHQEIKIAKEFLKLDTAGKTKYLFTNNKLARKDELADFLDLLLNGLWRTTRAALLASAYKNEESKTVFWRKKFLIVNNLRGDLESNLNHKIILLNLSVKL